VSPQRILAIVTGAVLVLTALWALYFQLSLPSKLPTEADHQAAARFIAERAEPNDVVLLFPWWTDRARLYLPERIPLVGYLGSDADALKKYARIWVVAQPQLPKANQSEFERLFLPQRTPVSEPSRFGPIEVRLYSNGRYAPTSFSVDRALDSARVFLEGADGTTADCQRFGASGFQCREGGIVAAEWHEVNFEPIRCLFVRPPRRGLRMVLMLPPEQVADIGLVRGGLVWDRPYYKNPEYTAVKVTLTRSDSDVVSTMTIEPGFVGMKEERIVGGGGGGELRFTVETANAEMRELCFDFVGSPKS
jgi:hypothetical protein